MSRRSPSMSSATSSSSSSTRSPRRSTSPFPSDDGRSRDPLMEAATLSRGGPAAYAQSLREAAKARSRAFWIVAGLTLLAAVLRFATLGVQAYHHDEIVTASRVLRGSFFHAMDAVGFSESAPPLYYALAWVWTQV